MEPVSEFLANKIWRVSLTWYFSSWACGRIEVRWDQCIEFRKPRKLLEKALGASG